ncbi:hypothetical protein P3X46_000763 [Hevea brasiliensis]|uniref:NB-ARC domain-containing protein n=1 Tax=Hevea brasiliensis TaxID=3981 RepID=A0ABQ9NB28_HEVBR|nr:disease resistance RPP13-like protein 4 [Hevea brasiliensis]XP_058002090.1 disease resistance RPP13-like protein 4 [Hevea brasiliensis]KAJ9189475.1 hypothetical protein P3X46_000763 [Hevea brasiliensis]KAJ9189476.1 hypothetical protein P3X46_000763 [Hevea brasiliensis]
MTEIAGTVLSTMIGQLLQVITNETQCARDFKREFDSMKEGLETINKLIGEQDKDNCPSTIKESLPKFRDLMYDADDILTDCVIRQEYKSKGLLSKFLPWNFFFQLRTCKKIQDINQRMKDKCDHLAKRLELTRGRSFLTRNVSEHFRWEQYYTSDEIIGLDSDVIKIKEWILLRQYKLQRIAIVGMGGLGKTTIAKLISDDADVSEHLKTKISVSASQNHTVEKFLSSIIQELDKNLVKEPAKSGSKSEQSGSKADDMLNRIISCLKERSCLIILDDIWDKNLELCNKFFSLLSKSTLKRCCIIITTRDQDVATPVGVDEWLVHKPKFLNENDSWSLFCKHAFAKVNKNCVQQFEEVREQSVEPFEEVREHSVQPFEEMRKQYVQPFEEVGKQIVAKCGGLPLAIKTIGGLLGSTGSLHKWNENWKSFCQPHIKGEKYDIMASLQLSYKALPLHLRQCLLCFSIYPEDCEIEAEKLIHWWVGEGLIQGNDSITATELGFQYLSKLISRCLVEVVESRCCDRRVLKCKMHDLVRDFTLVMAKEEKLCSFDDEGKQKFDKHSRWLGFTSEMDAKSLEKCPKLRALLLMTSGQTPFERNLYSLLSLRALDFSDNKLDKVALNKLFRWISSLKRLAYLNLSGAERLEEVPDSIGKLRNLHLLVLRGCTNLSKLSPSITYLMKLIVLDVDSCGMLTYLPRGLGRLCHLQELSGVRLVRQPNRRSCSLLELGQLVELRVLRMSLSNDIEITVEENEVLSKLNKLKILAINFDPKESEGRNSPEMLDLLSPPSTLEQLYLRCYCHERLPRWVSPDSLPHLVYLCMEEGYLLNDICTGNGSSWKVEGLCLKDLPKLKTDWGKLVTEQMKFLSYAKVSGCSELVNFPCHSSDKPSVWRRNPY